MVRQLALGVGCEAPRRMIEGAHRWNRGVRDPTSVAADVQGQALEYTSIDLKEFFINVTPQELRAAARFALRLLQTRYPAIRYFCVLKNPKLLSPVQRSQKPAQSDPARSGGWRDLSFRPRCHQFFSADRQDRAHCLLLKDWLRVLELDLTQSVVGVLRTPKQPENGLSIGSPLAAGATCEVVY